ncbi:MAG: tol-pal system protein YbgF [Elusimicrobiota bacterium]
MGVFLVILPFLFFGCAMRADVIQLNDNLYTLDDQIAKLQKKQSALEDKVEQLSKQLRFSQDNNSSILQKIESLNEKLANPSSPTSSQIFNAAYGDYNQGKYDLAISGFQNCLQLYPSASTASQAQYWLGECYLAKGDLEKALSDFEKVVARFPKTAEVPKAELKKAIILTRTNRRKEAVNLLKKIAQSYPGSLEAEQAKQKLQELTGE